MNPKDRYDATGLIEEQYEPGSRRRVLRNLLGIRSKRAMDKEEKKAIYQSLERLHHAFDRSHRFLADDIRRIHSDWLGKIYPWAGRYRHVDLTKDEFRFAHAAYVPALMAELEQGPLARYTPCAAGPIEKVAEALAVVHGELVLIHPFREGNGRVARTLATLMAFQVDYPPLEFRSISGKGKAAYVAAIHACLDRDYRPLTAVFEAILVDSVSPKKSA